MRQILCLDLEATCWKGSPPPGEVSEIIEIGYCIIDLTDNHTIRSEGLYILNTESGISRYCTDLTGITQETLNSKGMTFEAACDILQPLKQLPWISFGEYDKNFFQKKCLDRGVKYPLSYEHYNLKDIVNNGFKDLIKIHRGATKTFGLLDALHLFGMAFMGRQHSGKDDAINVGRLMLKLSSMMDRELVAKISADGNILRRKE